MMVNRGERITTDMTDDQIVQQVLQGDPEAFQGIIEHYQGPVLRWLRHLIGHEQASEDIAQDVFMTVYMQLKSYDPARSRFSTWLFTIARNKAINALKKKRPVCVAAVPEGVDDRDPMDASMEKEMMGRLDRELDRLPARQKRAFIWAEFEQLPYEEIARIEGVRLGTIKSRINRARTKLRAVLRESD